MVLLREQLFPKIRLTVSPCPWHETARIAHKTAFEKRLERWKQKATEYEKETAKTPFLVETVFVEIIELKTKCAYEVGQVIEVPALEIKPALKVAGAEYSDCWIKGIIKEIKPVQKGERIVYPGWELEPEPTYDPFEFSVHDAVRKMQQLICEVCPFATWEGFWTKYPEAMGYDDVVFTETSERHLGNIVHLESGVGYRVEVKGEQLVLCKFKIERYHFYSSVSSAGYSGIGSWSDKGYW
jgi:hypothetical protein